MKYFETLTDAVRAREPRTGVALPRKQPPGERVRSCPICGQPLTGKQTVCSARCRIERSRRRREAERQHELAKVRLLLRQALHLLEEGQA